MNAVRWKTATFAGHQLRYAVAGSGPAVVMPKKGSYRSGRAELDVVFRPTRRDRAVIGLPPEREQTR